MEKQSGTSWVAISGVNCAPYEFVVILSGSPRAVESPEDRKLSTVLVEIDFPSTVLSGFSWSS